MVPVKLRKVGSKDEFSDSYHVHESMRRIFKQWIVERKVNKNPHDNCRSLISQRLMVVMRIRTFPKI